MAKSTYGELLKDTTKYPVHLGTDGAYQDKVNAEKDRLRKERPLIFTDTEAVGKAYIASRAKHEAAEAAVYAAGVLLEAVTQIMHELFESKGITNKTIAGESKDADYGISTYKEPYANVKDPSAVIEWYRKNNLENKIITVVPWASVNAEVKQRLLGGDPEPDGVEIFTKRRVRLTRPKSKLPAEEGTNISGFEVL
jgi:hypothetical protein